MTRTTLTPEQKAERAEARKQAKREAERLAKIEAQKAQRPIAEMTINIEWRKSRLYGSSPVAEARIVYANDDGKLGCFGLSKQYRAGGCGYDKESTVVGQIFDDHLAYKLHRPEDWVREGVRFIRDETEPYGIAFYNGVGYYGQGVGMSCYYDIVKFIGGKLEHVASGGSFDVYRITFTQTEGEQA